MNTDFTERQKEIINASLEIIAESGIQNLTIKNLSLKIGIVESAIYRHYDSKTDILIALLDAAGKQTKYIKEKEVDSIFEFIEENLENHFMTFQENPALVSVVFAEDLFQNEPQLVEKTRLKMQKGLSSLSKLIQQGQQSGEIRTDIDAGIISVMINGSLRMLVKQWRMSGYSFRLIEKGKKLIETYRLLLINP